MQNTQLGKNNIFSFLQRTQKRPWKLLKKLIFHGGFFLLNYHRLTCVHLRFASQDSRHPGALLHLFQFCTGFPVLAPAKTDANLGHTCRQLVIVIKISVLHLHYTSAILRHISSLPIFDMLFSVPILQYFQFSRNVFIQENKDIKFL